MKKITTTLFLFIIFSSNILYAQDQVNVMFYNLLNFPNAGTSSTRLNYLKTILTDHPPDILLVCELNTSAGADDILNSALNVNGITKYQKANFVANQSTSNSLQNMAFYNTEKFTLTSQNELITDLRDINEYIFSYVSSNGNTITLDCYVAHLKASNDATSEARRLSEVQVFTDYIDAMGSDRNRIFCGDMNFYDSNETAYQELTINSGGTYTFIDPTGQAGNWDNNSAYASIHTQSTRTTSLGDGGATGGMDSRFDFIFISPTIQNNTDKISYVSNSYTTIGNDGNHFNQSIINGSNNSVSSGVLSALYNMSDHLPVSINLSIDDNATVSNTISTPKIAFVGYNADGTDDFSFVALEDIAASTEIKFTDNGWKSTDEFRTGEGIITWTAPAGGINCGTVVTITTTPTATTGTVGESGDVNFSGNGDQILAYIGDDNTPTFLAALNSEGSATWQSDASSTNTSDIPTGLTNGVNAIALSEVDNASYSGSTTFADNSTARTTINTNTNWINTSNSTNQTAPGSFTITDCTTLPIELISFEVEAHTEGVLLTWATASEINNHYFEIENSKDGINFEKIGEVAGAGTTNETQVYDFLHNTNLTGFQNLQGLQYYRLKQVDFDGAFEYHKVVSINIEGRKGQFKLYPNPTKENLTIKLPSDWTANTTIQIINFAGQILVERTFVDSVNHLNVADLPNGNYIIRATNANQTTTQRFIKLK